MGLEAVATQLAVQDGVVSRRQLLAAGLTQARIDTLLRRRALVVVHPGTYLSHTGTPTPGQRAWAAVLYAGRSALHLEWALSTTSSGPVDVAVDWTRRVRPQPGLRVHRVRRSGSPSSSRSAGGAARRTRAAPTAATCRRGDCP